MSEEEVERHNERESWREVVGHLRIARDEVELAQGALEDLRMSEWADQLQPLVDGLRQAGSEAAEKAGLA